MPMAAPRVCTYPGCGVLVHGASRCKQHDVRKLHDKTRKTAAQRGYDGRWKRARDEFLIQKAIEQAWPYPLCECEECREQGRRIKADTVDHIVPHKGDQQLFWDRSNWQAMHHDCHSRKTAREDGGFGR